MNRLVEGLGLVGDETYFAHSSTSACIGGYADLLGLLDNESCEQTHLITVGVISRKALGKMLTGRSENVAQRQHRSR